MTVSRNKINVLIIRTAGTNCDAETKIAFELLGAKVKLVHVNELVKNKKMISEHQIIAFPGGFTYGDDIAAGMILANELKMKLQDELQRFLRKNGLMIGICNGFQVLVKTGLLPGNKQWQQEVTLACNDSGKFEDRWVHLRKSQISKCVWTKGIDEVICMPVAHGEGKFIAKNKTILKRLMDNGQIVFQYCDKEGGLSVYPDNPNGSVEHIAGICDATGRIFGLMPHPERCVFKTQHPRWTRGENAGIPDGFEIFKNGIEFLKKA
ncbi:MAG: phosphoribosylformylglycinamidine synthase I [PVC group bacterium]|nr:phosphoribosylformylglycinamidine synthase I [PVC group bacterium]